MKITPEIEENLIKDYLKGYSWIALVDKYGASRQRLYSYIAKNSLKKRRDSVYATCPTCKKEFKTQRNNPKIYCKQSCYIGNLTGSNPAYTQHRSMIRQQQRNARIVAEMFSKKLERGYIVHHLDGSLANDMPDNLFVFYSQSKHLAFHHRLRRQKTCKPLVTDGYYVLQPTRQ